MIRGIRSRGKGGEPASALPIREVALPGGDQMWRSAGRIDMTVTSDEPAQVIQKCYIVLKCPLYFGVFERTCVGPRRKMPKPCVCSRIA